MKKLFTENFYDFPKVIKMLRRYNPKFREFEAFFVALQKWPNFTTKKSNVPLIIFWCPFRSYLLSCINKYFIAFSEIVNHSQNFWDTRSISLIYFHCISHYSDILKYFKGMFHADTMLSISMFVTYSLLWSALQSLEVVESFIMTDYPLE